MQEAVFHLAFPDETAATRSQLASSLSDSLRGIDLVKAEILRENPDSQDAGTILSIVLSAPSVVLAVRAIAAWATRNNQAKVDITTKAGTIVVQGLESSDVPKAIEALQGILRSR